MALNILPFALLHFLDYRKVKFGIAGKSRATLQKALVRRYLNYETSARASLTPTDLIGAAEGDAPSLVSDGYMNMLNMVSSIGQLGLVLIYQFTAPFIFGKPFRVTSLVPMFAFPLLMGTFLYFRSARLTRFLEAQNDVGDDLSSHVSQAVANYRLITEYNIRAHFVEEYEGIVSAFNKSGSDANQIVLNNTYYAKWLTTLAMASYTLVGGLAVLNGASLGMFLTDLSIIDIIGFQFGNIYMILTVMQTTFPALKNITKLLNFEIDIPQRMALSRVQRRTTRTIRNQLAQERVQGIKLDQVPILIKDLDFIYGGSLTSCHQRLRHVGTVEIKQGQLVAFVGKPGGGKSTLLKILGGVVLPTVRAVSGDDPSAGFFVPAHLRVLHVSQDPVFFEGTLYKNLALGVRDGDLDGSMARVVTICRRLGFKDSLLELVRSDEALAWPDVLCRTDQHLVCIARAIIANVEILVIHKPIMVFDDASAACVLKCLKEFVREKGLEVDPSTCSIRRPATCLYTTSKFVDLDAADAVLSVSWDGIVQVDKDTVDK